MLDSFLQGNNAVSRIFVFLILKDISLLWMVQYPSQCPVPEAGLKIRQGTPMKFLVLLLTPSWELVWS